MLIPTLHPVRSVRIVDVGPRDGLQNVTRFVPTPQKIILIGLLEAAGLRHIEPTSFVKPEIIPQMRDAGKVASALDLQSDNVVYWALAGNSFLGGQAIESGFKHLALFTSASNIFNRLNRGDRTWEKDLASFKRFVPPKIDERISFRGYISCVFGFETARDVSFIDVQHIAQEMLRMGFGEISLGDTRGLATPEKVVALIHFLTERGIPLDKLAMHFHQGQGVRVLDCVGAAFAAGIRIFDGSVGGIGGCPAAKKARGNVATEDLVSYFNGHSIETGINLVKLLEATYFLQNIVGLTLYSGQNASAVRVHF